MYLNSGVDYYVVALNEIEIECESGLRIMGPTIKFKLLSYPDLSKLEMMLNAGMTLEDINEEVCNRCIISIVGFEEERLSFSNSPAGVFSHIGTKIIRNSKEVIRDLEGAFQAFSASASIYDRLILVVSYYTNNSYEFCQNLPIDELVKRYALCSMAFPAQVPPIVFEKNEVSKVGG